MKLTSRKLEVLQKVTEGLTNKEIAAQLGISNETVKIHVRDLRDIAKVANRTQLAVWAIRKEILIGDSNVISTDEKRE